MIPLIVILPLLFASISMISNTLKIFEKYIDMLFLIGIFSPWPIFLINVNKYPIGTVIGGWSRISGVEVGINSINLFLILAALIVFSMVGVYSLSYFSKNTDNTDLFKNRSILPLILLAYGGILGCFMTRDLFNFFVYTEIASLSSIWLHVQEKKVLRKLLTDI